MLAVQDARRRLTTRKLREARLRSFRSAHQPASFAGVHRLSRFDSRRSFGSRFDRNRSFSRCFGRLVPSFDRPASPLLRFACGISASVKIAVSPAGSTVVGSSFAFRGRFFFRRFLFRFGRPRHGFFGRVHPAVGKFKHMTLMHQPVQIGNDGGLLRRRFGGCDGLGRGNFGVPSGIVRDGAAAASFASGAGAATGGAAGLISMTAGSG